MIPATVKSSRQGEKPLSRPLDRGRRFLKKLVRSIPAALALLVALCAAWAVVLASFLFLLAPRWARFGLPFKSTPAGRAVFFVVCVLSAWAAGRIKKALGSWWGRLFAEQDESKPAGRANLRAWRAAAIELYGKAFWVMAAAVAAMMLAFSTIDGAFGLAVGLIAWDAGRYLDAAFHLVGDEIHHLPPVLRPLAALLFFSFLPYGVIRFTGGARTEP